jgi:hypothetical protein
LKQKSADLGETIDEILEKTRECKVSVDPSCTITADSAQMQYDSVEEQAKELENEIKQSDASQVPLRESRNKVKTKQDQKRRERGDLQVSVCCDSR